MMNNSCFLPTYNLESPDKEFDCLYLPNTPQKRTIANVLKNSFALGGVNASLVIKKYAA
jgi:3-oxoacyl-(acyl-carrier-protein) synthase